MTRILVIIVLAPETPSTVGGKNNLKQRSYHE